MSTENINALAAALAATNNLNSTGAQPYTAEDIDTQINNDVQLQEKISAFVSPGGAGVPLLILAGIALAFWMKKKG